MLSPAVASTPAAAHSKPRMRAQTLTSPPDMINLTPSLSRSYRQPVGTGSLRRMQQQQQSSLGHARSRSQGNAMSALAAGPSTPVKGKRRVVVCDVVLEDVETDEDGRFAYPTGPLNTFLNSLGTPVTRPHDEPVEPQPLRPATPGKMPRVDPDKIRQSLHELWVTEVSYLRKLSSLHTHFAVPLRAFSTNRSTALIPAFEATHLFGNLDELVPIAEAFASDLERLVEATKRDKQRLPPHFGQVLLEHVERMRQPYKKWLANSTSMEAIRRELDRTNSSFREFVDRTQVVSRETTQATGGFKEFLAEPFQRISRYRLMLDPIILALPPDDPNVDSLQTAAGLLADVCRMETDDATQRAAVFWSLKETIDGFPDALVDFDRPFIDALDVDETFQDSDGRTTTLRCTLFLFSDKLLIAKRPSGTTSGKVHAGVDDIDRTVGLYQTSHLSSSQATLLGSPKKLRKGVLGYRGLVDLTSAAVVDLGSGGSLGSSTQHELGLLLDTPPLDQSERWCGRSTRRYTIAGTYVPEQRAREKERWLATFTETILRDKLARGARAARKGAKAWHGDGAAVESAEVDCAVWDRRTYESLKPAQRGKLALHLVESSSTPLLDVSQGRPMVQARVTVLEGAAMCCFEVTDATGISNSETIGVERVMPAMAELGVSYGFYAFPDSRPLSLSHSRSRPRSGLLNVIDLFTGGVGLKRGHSMTSRGSSAATTTINTPHLGDSTSSRQETSHAPIASLSRPRRPVAKKSAPDLSSSLHQREALQHVPRSEIAEASPYDGLAEVSDIRPRARTRPRRSFSLPPAPHVDFAPALSPHDERGLARDVEHADMEALEEPTVRPEVSLADSPWRASQEVEAPGTSPIAYRSSGASPRRRMIGPRDMRASPVTRSVDDPGNSSPSRLPFAREESPAPRRRPHTSNTSIATSFISPARSTLGDASFDSRTSTGSAAAKRARPPVEASPRPTPAKKVASLSGTRAGPREHPPSQPDLGELRRRISGERRIPSAASAQLRPRQYRTASGASTVRGPATPPREPTQPDVFSSPAAVAAVGPEQDVTMHDAEQTPFAQLREHMDDMRLKLAREVALHNKENESLVSPTALTRSPQTRNVFGKALQSEQPFSSPQARLAGPACVPSSDVKPRARALDKNVLAEWMRKLADLVDACEGAATAAVNRTEKAPSPTPVDPASQGSALEAAMLEQERDLLAAELNALKEDYQKLVGESAEMKKALETSQQTNAQYLSAYHDICQEAETILADFNVELADMMNAAQAEPSASGEYVELTDKLREAVSARYTAEHDLRAFRRQVASELAEKARMAEVLRQHGLSW
ncbi:uncharacterized protein JCM10292_005886 [Rhodotorula paludigena]|uniref:uncharacterized protein n=1 Tax=Rhodotorula paludigena TaxID=86838 RepID=UPI00317F5CAD